MNYTGRRYISPNRELVEHARVRDTSGPDASYIRPFVVTTAFQQKTFNIPAAPLQPGPIFPQVTEEKNFATHTIDVEDIWFSDDVWNSYSDEILSSSS